MNLNNKTLIVTGVSSGIGAEVARLARFQGARVIGVDRHEPQLTLDSFFQADLGDPASIDALIEKLPAQVDALCNIAGVPGTAPAEVVAKVNYLGLRHLTQGLLPRIAPGGSIVNVASVLGAQWPDRLELHKAMARTETYAEGQAWLAANPVAQETCYQYFKEALIVWTFQQSQAWFRDQSVRINCVAPGPVFTPILGDFVTMLGEERIARDGARMKRPAQADEVAEVIAFLCSDASRWINGVNLPVDGGLAATYV
ncbi:MULTISPECIES: coniferyl-alcohol dehydrogenase [Pseudomonas syringae group]|uniref:3-alpha-hydroxysteroid dehydrogenase n=1 Tax=Pseudomonas syringae pv. ribicola TaxID=55398 RepID=A0A0N8SNQ7_PSESI|nr:MULTISPECIES: coniferyl-alcohol dehydrogenase [Pseudomonas syringae group]EKN46778.1 3-alpha-hydroxysteroid dehydrogenase [Pseudomonas viridiflava UASWS0038]KPL61979.1 3-alpha-hydroxysteroid dehydrogenase [Pseudomonas viridiflava]KPY44264.1 3-alpha-hydroxysteroid dehydrogenase [Pseudomonas syringae pv. ribicola]KPZ21708.1 3-alpha-hydroxysteroid dehydrogenase [Pseudomonas viridiflava]OAG88203.1 3-alpha-hydroxysteroid dehydrogenase [Pseudomonas viridiflava]